MDRSAARSFLSGYTMDAAVRTVSKVKYHRSYHALLGLAGQTEDDAQSAGLHALSCAVYGWMPTILKTFHCDRFNSQRPVAAIRSIDTALAASGFINGMDRLAPLNGSWVGTSKLLHIINPGVFPIWDSRVAARFNLTTRYRINAKQSYVAYLNFIHADIQDWTEMIQGVRQHIGDVYNYRPTDVRCLELLLFADGNPVGSVDRIADI